MDTNIEKQQCIRCSEILPITSFNKRRRKTSEFDNRCRNCVNKRRNEWNVKNRSYNHQKTLLEKSKRRDYVNSIKSAGCSKCGYNKCLMALTFHHMDKKTKIDTISNMICSLANMEVIKNEIKKCILLCQNCHHELHESQKDMGLNHNSTDQSQKQKIIVYK